MTVETDKANYDRQPERSDPRMLSDSTTLRSSSKYLNHGPLREWIATEYLRRQTDSYDDYAPVMDLWTYCRDLTDPEVVNSAFRAARIKDQALDRWFERGYLADYSDLTALASLEPGTLGREFYDELIVRRDLKPDFLPDFKPVHEADYWLRRAQQIHDIHHILTGSALNNGGEVRIIGIYTGNWTTHLPAPLAAELCAYNTLLVHAFLTRIGLHRIEAWGPHIAALNEGYQMGSSMEPLYLPEYEQMWDVPLVELRRRMNIVQPADPIDTAWLSSLSADQSAHA
jgi:ubiquinone biosynthesis protein COQ4